MKKKKHNCREDKILILHLVEAIRDLVSFASVSMTSENKKLFIKRYDKFLAKAEGR
jgi:hypothetical protein